MAVTSSSNVQNLITKSGVALTSNARTKGVMASPPVVTANGTTIPAALTTHYFYNNTTIDNSVFKHYGGKTVVAGGNIRRYNAMIGTSGGNTGTGDGKQTSAWRSEVIVDAAVVAFQVGPTSSPYRFLVNGQYVDFIGTNTVGTTGSTTEYITLDFSTVGGRAVRSIIMEGQATCALSGVQVGPTETCWRPQDNADLTAVLIGDSYAFGSDATALGDGFGFVLSDYLGIKNIWSSGSGGTGWATTGSAYNFLQRIQNGDVALCGTPDVVFLMGSYNDRSNTPATITANVLLGLQTVRKAYPNALIFVLGVCPGNTGPSAGILAAEVAMQSAVAGFVDSYTRFVPFSLSVPPAISGTGTNAAPNGTGNSDVYTDSGGVHPPTIGHAFIGQYYAQGIQTATTSMR